MKFTLSWLKEHLETDATVEAIATALTGLGLEVEEVVDPAKALAPFRVAYVQSAEPHPNADRLKVCSVETAEGVLQVICGAPNARTGMKGVFAHTGTHIPGTGLDLKKGLIRGVESNGMLLSERELGLSDEHQGIIEVAEDVPVGTPFASVLGLDDPVFDIALTPDRGDCAGIHAIARDLAAAGLGRLTPLATPRVPGTFASPIGVALSFPGQERPACPYFVGRAFRGLKNGPSPKWLQDRLKSIGLRPISTLVDITNFFTVDRNRPLHVFDLAKLRGGLNLRMSRPGDRLTALNDKTYDVAGGEVIIIEDEARPVAFGGVMGGEETGCTEETTDVFLEVAYFDPVATAMSGRALGIESDARYRFERGVDPAFVAEGAEQATAMILELCGGEASELVVAGAEPAWQRTIGLRPDRVGTLGGLEVPEGEQTAILERLGFRAEGEDGDRRLFAVPPWRPDIDGEADLVEEVLRVSGYDRVAPVSLEKRTALTVPAVTHTQRATGSVRRTLAARGLDEAVTWAFMDSRKATQFGFQHRGLMLVNPIASDLDVMRPSALPNLLDAARRNLDRGLGDPALFEVGGAYHDPSEAGQRLVAAGLRAGQATPRHWSEPRRAVDVFDAKADALAALEAAGAPVANLQTTTDAPDWFHPGRAGVFRLGANVLAHWGEIHPATLRAMDLDVPTAAFEVFLDRVPVPKRKTGTARPLLKLSPFQPVRRDFAFLVDRTVAAEAVIRAARGADKALISDVAVFDLYEGGGIEEGRKSLAIEVTLQPVERTLTDQEIDAVAEKVVAAVAKQTGAMLRG